MIAKLKGLVDSTGEDWVILDVGGVGYLVQCSSRTLGRLPASGEAAALLIETHVREDAIQLYGFFDKGERDWFRLLTTVQGVGARVALSLLSAASPDQILQAIAAGDKVVLTRAAGVGPKLALRILTELKDKAGAFALTSQAARAAADDGGSGAAGGAGAAVISRPAEGGALGDAVSALVNLGYQRVIAFEAVGRAAQALGDEADVSALIRAALRDLAPRDPATIGRDRQ